MPPEEIVPEIPANPEMEHLIVQSEENHQELMTSLDTLIQQGEENNPEAILEASVVTQDAILEETKATKQVQEKMLSQLEKMTSEETTVILRGHQGKRGEKGDKGDTPEKGKDYFTTEEVESFKKEVTPVKGVDYKDGEDGKDYILTEEDKSKIAASIEVPVVEKIIEKTEIIKEQPIVTNETKEVAKYETAEEIVEKINTTKESVSFNVLKDIPLFLRTRQSSRDYSFLELTDTPKTYTGFAGNAVRVKSDESGLEFSTTDAGDVIGPSSATDNAVARFDGITGKLIQNSVVVISDAGAVTGVTDLTISTFTAGSVLFAGTAGILTQDNANFFWDDTNNRLGIGTASPTVSMEVKVTNSNGSFTDIQKYSTVDTASGRQDVITFSGGATSNRGMKIRVEELTSGGTDTGFGASGFVFFLNEIRIFHDGAYPVTFYTTALERGRFAATGELGVGVTSPTAKLHIKQVVATSGTAKSLIVDNFNHTAQTASTEINNVAFNTYTRQWATGALTTQRENFFDAPTYAFVGASTITTAATVAISGAPIAGTNATITTPLSLWVQGGTSLFAGAVTIASSTPVLTIKDTVNSGANTYIPRIDFVTSTDVIRGRIDFNTSVVGALTINNFSGSPNGQIIFRTASTNRIVISSGGLIGIGVDAPLAQLHVSPALFSANAVGTAFTVTGASHLALTASTEFPDVNLNLARTVQWATGALTAQRAVLIQAPTYAFVGASTISDAATLAITGAPAAGTNATITRSMALWIQSGYVSAVGGLTVGTTTAPGFAGRLRLDQTDGASAASVIEISNGTNTLYWFIEGVATGSRAQIRTDSTRPVVLQDNATSSLGPVNIGTANATGFKLYLASGAASSGIQGAFKIASPSHTGQTASTEVNNVYFETYTRQWATGAIATQREFRIAAPTYAFVGASTITDAATVEISDGPLRGTNATITNSAALKVGATSGNVPLIIDTANVANQPWLRLVVGATNVAEIRNNAGFIFKTLAALDIKFSTGGANVKFQDNSLTDLAVWNLRGDVALTPLAASSGIPVNFALTGAAHTAQTASTEVFDVNFNLARTVQHATGALTMQRAFVIQAPTYSFVGASTLTIAATTTITKTPIQGTNATISNTTALLVGDPITSITSAVAGDLYMQVIVPEGIDSGVGTVTGRTGLLVTTAGGQISLGNQTATLSYYRGISIESVNLISTTNTRTVTNASSLYIAGAPASAGNITFTNGPYAIFVDAGLSRFDGNGTHVFELPADATGNTTAATGRIPVLIGGALKYLRYYND